jgi:endonuclease G
MLVSFLPAKQKYGLEVPKLKSGEKVIQHTGFALVYSEKDEQAKWVAYALTKEEAASEEAERTDRFLIDSMVKTGTANDKDYYKSGYSKGHLCPANDNTWSVDAMHDCFYFSNMTPQYQSFNGGVWETLESEIHDLAAQYDTIYIVTGPVLKKPPHHKFATIGKNQVTVPDKFFKVIMVYGTEPKAIGYIIPQVGFTSNPDDYAVSVDAVEKATGLDFHNGASDNVEKKIEKHLSNLH